MGVVAEKRRDYYVDVPCVVSTVTRKALLLFSDLTGVEGWVPLSLVRHCTIEGVVPRGLTVEDLERDDVVTVTIPRWLARKEALIEEE